jgi:hypothetical protein
LHKSAVFHVKSCTDPLFPHDLHPRCVQNPWGDHWQGLQPRSPRFRTWIKPKVLYIFLLLSQTVMESQNRNRNPCNRIIFPQLERKPDLALGYSYSSDSGSCSGLDNKNFYFCVLYSVGY